MSEREPPQFVYDLLRAPPRRTEGLNRWFFRVARVLHPYRDADGIIALLQAVTAGEPVRRGEIERAVERSKSYAWQPGQPCAIPLPSPWPKFYPEKRRAVVEESKAGLVDLWELSPVRIETGGTHTEEIIDALFPGNPLLCCGRSQIDFDTRPRFQWRGALSRLAVIVPSPMTAWRGPTQDGNESAHALSITGPRRFLVVEFDSGDVDEHAALLLRLADDAPLTLVVHSGSKSLHGWFAVQNQTEEQLKQFMRTCVSLGADPATWTRSQFVRMPDGLRNNGKRQVVYFFNPRAVK